jgi:transcriptional regulator with GAF, ATPase, and Fis domain
MLGESPAMLRLRAEIEAVAVADYNVLITGESGSGKELAARTIHGLSRRSRRPMLTVNCTAIPEQLMESELFGHVKGAFTGAERSRQGLFVAASGSSLLLDEIGDMPLRLQPKLLRALQEKEIRPLGGTQNIPVDARILASTNQRLEQCIASGVFREDLYYRLNVLTVRVPPLRERTKDIPILAVHFLARACQELDIEDKRFEPESLERLAGMPWPGNVRELLNGIRRLAVFCRGPVIGKSQVQLLESVGAARGLGDGGLAPTVGVESYKSAKARFSDDFTRAYVEKLLEETGGNISQAARVSGLERVSLQKILKRLGVEADRFRQAHD